MTHERRRALVLERDSLTRERACRLLESEGYATCALSEPRLFDEVLQALSFDLIVIGIASPEETWMASKQSSSGAVLLLAPQSDPGLLAHLRLRAPGALIADRSLRQPDVLRRVLPGGQEPEARPSGIADVTRRAFAPFGLSERQLEVLEHALLGETSGEIARKLRLSELTVRNHLHAIYQRAGVSGRRALSARVLRGLVSP
jgi:DNA-binding NarL/FixJ family response regulator